MATSVKARALMQAKGVRGLTPGMAVAIAMKASAQSGHDSTERPPVMPLFASALVKMPARVVLEILGGSWTYDEVEKELQRQVEKGTLMTYAQGGEMYYRQPLRVT